MSGTGLSLAGATVVVTGGGSGIGAALATRFAADGARVVVNDIDAGAAGEVADRIGALAWPGDVADPAAVAGLVEATRDRHGEIDLFCSNAGVATGGGLDSDPAAWDLSWRVNVLAHAHAAQALLPGWLAAGRGRLLVTASAAGLLTMLGNAPYSVTKHAAVGFAEWLHATYAHRGITVQALCPQGVRTPMLARADGPGGALLDPTALSPEQVAECVVRALADDRFLVLPHPEVATYYARRAGDPDRWLRGMNRLQLDLEAGSAGGRPDGGAGSAGGRPDGGAGSAGGRPDPGAGAS